MTDPLEDAVALPPDSPIPARCPCCGAALDKSYNEEGKVRRFAYACGAGGLHTEAYREDPATGREVLWRVGSLLTWVVDCPEAMERFTRLASSHLAGPIRDFIAQYKPGDTVSVGTFIAGHNTRTGFIIGQDGSVRDVNDTSR